MIERPMRPIARASLSRRVAVALEQYVTTRGLAAGDRLPPERDLTRHLQVSGPVLREALRLLEAQGVLRTHHGKGIFVVDPQRARLHAPEEILPDGASFAELREVRVALEVGLVPSICARATEEDCTALESILTPPGGEGDRPVFNPRIDLAFHLRFVQIAGNTVATHICERVLTPYFRANALLNPNMGWVGSEVFDARFRRGRHLAIVGALRTRDVEHLQQLVALHLDEERIAEERFAALMEQAGAGPLVSTDTEGASASGTSTRRDQATEMRRDR